MLGLFVFLVFLLLSMPPARLSILLSVMFAFNREVLTGREGSLLLVRLPPGRQGLTCLTGPQFSYRRGPLGALTDWILKASSLDLQDIATAMTPFFWLLQVSARRGPGLQGRAPGLSPGFAGVWWGLAPAADRLPAAPWESVAVAPEGVSWVLT